MAKFVALNVPVTVGTTVLTDHCARVEVNFTSDALDSTAYGTTGWRSKLQGLKTGTISLDFQQDFAAGSVNAVLGAVFTAGTANVIVGGTALGTGALGTAPCVITDFKPHASAVGDLATQQVQWELSDTPTGFGL